VTYRQIFRFRRPQVTQSVEEPQAARATTGKVRTYINANVVLITPRAAMLQKTDRSHGKMWTV